MVAFVLCCFSFTQLSPSPYATPLDLDIISEGGKEVDESLQGAHQQPASNSVLQPGNVHGMSNNMSAEEKKRLEEKKEKEEEARKEEEAAETERKEKACFALSSGNGDSSISIANSGAV